MQINNNFQKNANISMVAHLLWRSPGISRVEIARQLDLYRSTVSNIINTLIDNGVVFEEKEGVAMPQGGRKPICLELNGKFGCVAGIEVQPSGYHVVVVDVFGNELVSTSAQLPKGTLTEIVEFIVDNIMPEVEATGIPLLGICVGIPGIIDLPRGIIVRSDPFHISNLEFTKNLSTRYHVPVMIENDANCLAWLELAKNREENIRNFICVNAEYYRRGDQYGDRTGMGVGLGVALDGNVFSGSKNAAGEFVSISWKGSKDNPTGQNGLPAEVLGSIENDPESFALWVLDLFSSLIPVISVLDPEAVFVHGELARNADRVKKILEDRVPQFDCLLKKQSCSFAFENGSTSSVATGAALMYFLNLFSVPGSNVESCGMSLEWDTVFKLSAAGR